MQQRYYDPQIGRFLSNDPVSTDVDTGNNFNRYWYANNNPYRFNDPDGREPGDVCDSGPIDCDNHSKNTDGAAIYDDDTAIRSQEQHDFGRAANAINKAKPVLAVGVEKADEEAMNPWNWIPFFGEAKSVERVGAATAERAGAGEGIAAAWMAVKDFFGFGKASAIASKISGGHAFAKHASEFAGLGIKNEKQFERLIEGIVRNPSAERQLSQGRVAYWDDLTKTVVIHNPGAVDGGTAFRPTLGRLYFDEVLK